MARSRALVCMKNHAKPAVLYASFHTGLCVLPGSDFTRIDGWPTQIAAKSGAGRAVRCLGVISRGGCLKPICCH